MVLQRKPIPKKIIPPPKARGAQDFDYSVGYNPNPNYNVFDKKTQNVYSPDYTTRDGFINFAGGVRMEAAGISQNDVDGLSKFFSDSANDRNLFHEKQYDSINEAKRVKEQGVSWGNWEGMDNNSRLNLFKKMYGNSAISSYNMLDGSELRGNGDGGKLSAINVSLDNLKGGQTSFDARDSETFYNALNKGAIFGSQAAQFQRTTPQQAQQTPQQPRISSIFGENNKQQGQPSNGFRSLQHFNKPPTPMPNLGAGIMSPQGPKQMPMPNPRRNLIPRPINPKYKMM